jgi:hypothetical protein
MRCRWTTDLHYWANTGLEGVFTIALYSIMRCTAPKVGCSTSPRQMALMHDRGARERDC